MDGRKVFDAYQKYWAERRAELDRIETELIARSREAIRLSRTLLAATARFKRIWDHHQQHHQDPS